MTLIELNNITKTVSSKEGNKLVLDNISLSISSNSKLAIIGPSGSGKTSLAKVIKGYFSKSSGSISFKGQVINSSSQLLANSKIQLVFQDPDQSLTPKRIISNSIIEFLRKYKGLSKADAFKKLSSLASELKIGASQLNKYPHELSGGEKQRVALIRALLVEPEILICDEILSALDQPLQEDVLNLLMDYQRKSSFALVFISHDLSMLVKFFDETIIVVNARVVDRGRLKDMMYCSNNIFLNKSTEALSWLSSP